MKRIILISLAFLALTFSVWGQESETPVMGSVNGLLMAEALSASVEPGDLYYVYAMDEQGINDPIRPKLYAKLKNNKDAHIPGFFVRMTKMDNEAGIYEGEYRYFAVYTDKPDRTKIVFYKTQPYKDLACFFTDDTLEVTKIEPGEMFLFFDETFRLRKNYYSEMMGRYETKVQEYLAAEAKVTGLNTKITELEADKEKNKTELEALNLELGIAVADLDSKNIDVETLQGKVDEYSKALDTCQAVLDQSVQENAGLLAEIESLKKDLDARDKKIQDLEKDKAGLETKNASLQKDLDKEKLIPRDEYKIKMNNLNRGPVFFVMPFGCYLDANYDFTQMLLGMQAEPTLVMTAENTGTPYFLVSLLGDLNSNVLEMKYAFSPKLVVSAPMELIQVGFKGYLGTSGAGSIIFRDGTDKFSASIGSYLKSTIPGEELKVSLLGGFEGAITDRGAAFTVAASAEFSPKHISWITVLLNDFSYTMLTKSNILPGTCYLFNFEAGFMFNIFKDISKDQWFDKGVLQLGFLYNYWILSNWDLLKVNDVGSFEFFLKYGSNSKYEKQDYSCNRGDDCPVHHLQLLQRSPRPHQRAPRPHGRKERPAGC
jgi:hypothetical protein